METSECETVAALSHLKKCEEPPTAHPFLILLLFGVPHKERIRNAYPQRSVGPPHRQRRRLVVGIWYMYIKVLVMIRSSS